MDVGDAEHEPETGGRTTIVTGAEFVEVVTLNVPPVTVQVATYVVVFAGDTETVPPEAGVTAPMFEILIEGPEEAGPSTKKDAHFSLALCPCMILVMSDESVGEQLGGIVMPKVVQ